MSGKATPEQAPTDAQLMLRYREGDERAFRLLYDRHATWLIALMRRKGAAPHESLDLTQQTFIQLHGARHDYREDAPLRPWLYTIALNVYRQHLRVSKRQPLSAFHELEHTATNGCDIEERIVARDVAAKAAEQLSEEQREVVRLRMGEGLSHAEIAKRTGSTENAVKLRLHRSLQQLRGFLVKRKR